jgi:ABC-type bacteriocin/lantibiotic exporter with double-glycine peptidase domain
VSSIDNTVTNSVTDVVSDVMGFVASLGAVLFIVPRFIAFAAAAMALYVFLATPYVRASRDLRRL